MNATKFIKVLMSGMIVIAALIGITGCDKQAGDESMAESAKAKMEKAMDSAEEMAEDAADKTSEAMEEAGDAMEDTADDMADATEDAMEDAGDAMEEASDKVKESME